MRTLESKQISDFKHDHADIFAWVYSNCRKLSNKDEKMKEFGKKVLNMASFLDHVEYNNNLVDAIRKKVGINPADIEATKLNNAFPEASDPTYNAASGWGEYVRKLFSIDIGAIEELFDEIIDGLMAIYNYIKELFVGDKKDSATKLLEEIDIIMESLKNMRSNTPLLVHMQTKIEMSQSAKMSVA